MLNALPDLQSEDSQESQILDLWDKQSVSLRLEEAQPALTQLFIAAIRIARSDLETLLTQSGPNGRYVEPRDDAQDASLHHSHWAQLGQPS